MCDIATKKDNSVPRNREKGKGINQPEMRKETGIFRFANDFCNVVVTVLREGFEDAGEVLVSSSFKSSAPAKREE